MRPAGPEARMGDKRYDIEFRSGNLKGRKPSGRYTY
jgi:hypothetical protein